MCLPTRHRRYIFTPSEFTCKTLITNENELTLEPCTKTTTGSSVHDCFDFKESAIFNGQMDLLSRYESQRPQNKAVVSPLFSGEGWPQHPKGVLAVLGLEVRGR